MKIIVLEGIDNTGKSTLYNALKKKHPQWLFLNTQSAEPLIKSVHPTLADAERLSVEYPNEMWQYKRNFALTEAIRDANNSIVVIDRLWLSFIMYNLIPKPSLIGSLKQQIDDTCLSVHTLISYFDDNAVEFRKDDKRLEEKGYALRLIRLNDVYKSLPFCYRINARDNLDNKIRIVETLAESDSILSCSPINIQFYRKLYIDPLFTSLRI